MASVIYSLKRPDAKKSAIVCRLSAGREYQIKLYTGVSINPRHWSKKQYVLSANTDAITLNKSLQDFKSSVLKIYFEARSKKILPDLEYFKREMQPEPEDKTTFWDIWNAYIESKKGIFKPHSFVKFNALKTHLQGFEKSKKMQLVLDNIDSDLMEDFQNYLYFHEDNPKENKDKKRLKKPLNTQSSEKYIGIFKMFLNWCVKRKHTTNSDYKNFAPIKQPDSLKVVMTDEDIEKLKKVDLGEKNYLKNVRALFLLACGTGLRYSDFSRIGQQHLKQSKEGYTLELRQTKTEDHVSIPLTDESLQTVRDLIDGKLHAVSNQKMNSYVKELCQLAGIDEPFEIHTYQGRKKTINTVPKYQLVSTHTGRRTFATNLLQKGIPAQIVMVFTGHRDYKSFSKYVNIPKQTEMEMVRNALSGKLSTKMWVAS